MLTILILKDTGNDRIRMSDIAHLLYTEQSENNNANLLSLQWLLKNILKFFGYALPSLPPIF